MSNWLAFAIFLICTIEQYIVLSATIYFVGFQGWSPYWIVLSVLLICTCAPSLIIAEINKHL